MERFKDFEHLALELLEQLFDEGEIETLFLESEMSVKVVHVPSRLEAEEHAFDSQVKNKALALLRLLESLPRHWRVRSKT